MVLIKSSLILIFVSSSLAQNTQIYEAKKGVIECYYISNLGQDTLVLEQGGTTLKVGGHYEILVPDETQKNRYYNQAKTLTVDLISKRIYFNTSSDGLKLKMVSNTPKVQKNRRNIFTFYWYKRNNNQWLDHDKLEKEYLMFLKNPLYYITQYKS
jgi:hypothetical protein